MRPYIRAANVTWDGIDTTDVKEMDFSPDEYEVFSLREGDILLSEASGSSSEVGKPAVWTGQIPGACYQNTLIRVRTEPSLAPFLYWYFRHAAKSGEFAAKAKGIGIHHLGASTISKWKVNLPPPLEQERIVSALRMARERADAASDLIDEAIAYLSRLRLSVMISAFRGELEIDSKEQRLAAARVAMPSGRAGGGNRAKGRTHQLSMLPVDVPPSTGDDSLGAYELPAGWAWASLSDVLDRIESGTSMLAQSRPAQGEEFGVLKLSAISWGEFDPNENKALLPGTATDGVPHVQAGDLLISRANTVELIGAVVIARQDYPNLLLSDKTLRLVPNEVLIDPEFLLLALRMPWVRRFYEKQATGTSNSMQNLSRAKIRSAPIALPPLDEQRKIVSSTKSAMDCTEKVASLCEAAVQDLKGVELAVLEKAMQGRLVEKGTAPISTNDYIESLKKWLNDMLEQRVQSRRGKPTHAKTKMRASREGILQWVDERGGATFAFDELRKGIPSSYDELKAALFNLLSDPTSGLEQYFDSEYKSIRFRTKTR